MQIGSNLGLSAIPICEKLLLVIEQLLSSFRRVFEVLGYGVVSQIKL